MAKPLGLVIKRQVHRICESNRARAALQPYLAQLQLLTAQIQRKTIKQWPRKLSPADGKPTGAAGE
eukprot:272137-Lingulodinium_polyedra.AAC.1